MTISIAGAGWVFTCSHNLGNGASCTQIWHRMNGEQEMQRIGPSNRVSIYFLLQEHGGGEVASNIASFCINFNYGNELHRALGLMETHQNLPTSAIPLSDKLESGADYCVFIPNRLPNVEEEKGICVKVRLVISDRLVEVVVDDDSYNEWKFIKDHFGCPIFCLNDNLLVGFVFYSDEDNSGKNITFGILLYNSGVMKDNIAVLTSFPRTINLLLTADSISSNSKTLSGQELAAGASQKAHDCKTGLKELLSICRLQLRFCTFVFIVYARTQDCVFPKLIMKMYQPLKNKIFQMIFLIALFFQMASCYFGERLDIKRVSGYFVVKARYFTENINAIQFACFTESDDFSPTIPCKEVRRKRIPGSSVGFRAIIMHSMFSEK